MGDLTKEEYKAQEESKAQESKESSANASGSQAPVDPRLAARREAFDRQPALTNVYNARTVRPATGLGRYQTNPTDHNHNQTPSNRR